MNEMVHLIQIITLSLVFHVNLHVYGYIIDGTQPERQFDGIAGLSGGGATSKLLINYAEPYRSQILDFLFKPNFGASLQILKVEIGGDSQSTEGTESSHMHNSWEENYYRGYEWWLMVEAKKRNPNIKLYGLPWAWPGWLGEDGKPWADRSKTADYIIKWIEGAKRVYNLQIDFIGVWNERMFDIEYIIVLRKMLDARGHSHVKIVAADGNNLIAISMLANSTLFNAVDYIGIHYPGTESSDPMMRTKKQLWASEDYSTLNNAVGTGCWARILNQNYVNGYYTSTISWNLIASYYQNLPYGRDGLMTAQSPWSGHYVVQGPIWVSAHTTQFTSIGWKYLKHGSGVGHLTHGGSYVSLVSPFGDDFTMVLETMSHEHSKCIRPYLPPYNTSAQTATFTFKGTLAKKISKLYVWITRLGLNDRALPTYFQQLNPIMVNNGSFTLNLDTDELYTITTLSTGIKGSYPAPPIDQSFPLPYADNFESYPVYSEAFNFVPQVGVWEVRSSSNGNKVNRQVVLEQPVDWCSQKGPIDLGGDFEWKDINVTMDVLIPRINGTSGVGLAQRISKGGCATSQADGIFFYVFINGSYVVSTDLGYSKILKTGPVYVHYDTWYSLSLIIKDSTVSGYINKVNLFSFNLPKDVSSNGFAGYTAASWGYADFDNLIIQAS